MKRCHDIMKNWKWRQTVSIVLIICLLSSVALSTHMAGVFATSDMLNDLADGSRYATPADAEKKNDDEEDNWHYASSSNATSSTADWLDASPSNASPSNALEYEQLTLEDDSEPVTVSGILPIGTKLVAEPISEEELQDCGMEELELETASVVFAYHITLWLNGRLYQPEYTLTVRAENMELLDGELNLIKLETDEVDKITGYHTIPFNLSKEGNVSFTMTKLASYAAVDMGNPENIRTITDTEQHVVVTGELPENITVTAETLSEEVLSQMELPEGKVTFAYDVKLWKKEKEYQPEKPVKITLLNPENDMNVYEQDKESAVVDDIMDDIAENIENMSDVEETEKAAGTQNQIAIFSVATDELGVVTDSQTVEDTVDEEGNLSFVTNTVSAYVSVEMTQNEDVAALIDADIALLKWKATHDAVENTENITITVENQDYQVADDDSYKTAYTALYNALKNCATVITGTLDNQEITENTVWNISGTVTMSKNVSVGNGKRLVVLGDGTIQKNAACGIISSGTVALQGNVFFNGNKNANSLFCINVGEGYLTDEFRLGNNQANGIDVNGGTFYMSGGLIGTKNITFAWYNEDKRFIENKNYEDTWSYIEQNLESENYNYVISKYAEDGCVEHGLNVRNSGNCYVSGGVIAGNGKGQGRGGGCIIAGEATITDGLIMGNVANYCGGLYVESAGTATITGGKVYANYANTYNGGIDVGGTLTLKGTAIVAYNSCGHNGGGITVEGGKATCILDGQAQVIHNTAIGTPTDNYSGGTGNGGGFRVVGTLSVIGGIIAYNNANGRLEECPVSFNAGHGGGINGQTDSNARVAGITLTGGVIRNNKAHVNGGGVYVTCIISNKATFSMQGTSVRHNQAEKNGGGIYLSARNGELNAEIESGMLTDNKAGESGGGCYLELGEYKANSTGSTAFARSITVKIGVSETKQPVIEHNTAVNNGGGICVARSENNTSADNTINVNVINGILQNNQAENGGAISVQQGAFCMTDGKVENNTASNNGGGIYVTDGNVKIYDGVIASNIAKNGAGGGLFVRSEKSAVDVKMLSGILSSNKAQTVGGGMAVEGLDEKSTVMTVGACQIHPNLNYDISQRTFTPFSYEEPDDQYIHKACPAIKNNVAGNEGGGLFLSGANSSLNLYCLIESGNTATKNAKSNGMKVEGGSVEIGDISKKTGDYQNAAGNVVMENSVLVKGGKVDAYGSMENPYFSGQITVDVEKEEDHYIDWRKNATEENVEYKIHYYENFQKLGEAVSGLYYARQYKNNQEISIESAMFVHPGWKIIGWNTKQDGSGKTYSASDKIILNDEVEGMDKAEHQLTLYAIWEQCLYTIVFVPNAPLEVGYTGVMENQACTVGDQTTLNANLYHCNGYEFIGWNLKSDGKSEDNYANEAIVDSLSSENGATVKLYAQWKLCNHIGTEKLSYDYDSEKMALIETCVCGNHIAYAKFLSANTTYDTQEHPVIVRYEGDAWNGEKPVLTYTRRDLGTDVSYEPYEENPEKAGEYKAVAQAGGKQTDPIIYQINKAVQEISANALTYQYDASAGRLTINPLELGTTASGYHAKPEYKIKVNGTEREYTENNTFVLGTEDISVNRYYSLYARYAETENYLASEPLEAGLYLTSKAMVRFVLDPGISVEDQTKDTDSNYVYQVKLEDGYHKDYFSYKAEFDKSTGINTENATCKFEKNAGENILYTLTVSAAAEDQTVLPVIVTISGVKKDAKISVNAEAGQWFQALDEKVGTEISVNENATFTAQFYMKDWNGADYSDPQLIFSKKFPQGTAIIMQANNDYWYYTVDEADEAVPLSKFKRMGDGGFYKESAADFYRISVDFSGAMNLLSDADTDTSATMKLQFKARTAENTENTAIPELEGIVTIHLQKAASISGMVTSSGSASVVKIKYNQSALSMEEQDGKTMGLKMKLIDGNSNYVPDDLCLVVTTEGETTEYPISAEKAFSVPLGELKDYELQIYLQSASFCSDSMSFSFKSELYISDLKSGGTAMLESGNCQLENISLKLAKTEQPSVKMSAGKRLYQNGKDTELLLTVETMNLSENYVTELSVLKKGDDGAFDTDTAYRDYQGAGTRNISLEQLDTGSYCLKMVVSEDGRTILEVPYYFIIMSENQELVS